LELRQECFAHSLQPITFAEATLRSKAYAIAQDTDSLLVRCQRARHTTSPQ